MIQGTIGDLKIFKSTRIFKIILNFLSRERSALISSFHDEKAGSRIKAGKNRAPAVAHRLRIGGPDKKITRLRANAPKLAVGMKREVTAPKS
jgi:hypothetical protein